MHAQLVTWFSHVKKKMDIPCEIAQEDEAQDALAVC